MSGKHLTHIDRIGAYAARHANMAKQAKQAKAVLKTETLDAVADRGYFGSLEILGSHEAGITVTLPKPMTSGAKFCVDRLRRRAPHHVSGNETAESARLPVLSALSGAKLTSIDMQSGPRAWKGPPQLAASLYQTERGPFTFLKVIGGELSSQSTPQTAP